jgi:hypothetical protein
MMNPVDPLEKRLITDLPRQLDRAIRPIDPTAVARAAAQTRPSIMRITAATAVVAIVAVVGVVALQGLISARGGLGAPGASESPTPSDAGASDVGVEQLATIQRADSIISTRLSATENAILVNAHGALVEACMQERGWDFELAMATPEEAGAGPDFMSNLEQWTFADVARAESQGYGFRRHLKEVAAFREQLPEGEGEARIPDPVTMSPEDSARFELDYFGTEEERIEILERDGSHAGIAGGGCWGQAERAIWGEDLEREMWLIDARGTAQSDIWVATETDDAVLDALDAWKACMRQEGFDFQDPHHAIESALPAAQSGDFERERLIARTDAACKAESRLDLAVQAAYLSATTRVLPELEDDLLALQQLEAEALVRAKEILGLDN